MQKDDNVTLSSQQLVLQEVQKLPQALKSQKKLLFKKGEDPLNSAHTDKYFYFILSGKIKIFQIDLNSSKEQTLYMLSQGDMFDVVSLLDGSQNRHISQVLEESEVIQIPLCDVKEMIEIDNKFRQFFYTYIANQLKSMEDLAVSLSFYDVFQRVLHLFSKFTYIKNDKAELRVIDNLSHEELASMVGSVRKVVNRSLQTLKKDGVIDVKRKKIFIKDFTKLFEKLSL